MKISTPREDCQLIKMFGTNRFVSAPRIRMQMIPRFGRRMSVRTIRRWLLAAGYWSRRPARCPRHTGDAAVSGGGSTEWDLRQWGHCIFSDESRFSLYHSEGRVRVRHRQGERLIDACALPKNGNHGPSVMAWGALHHGGWSELVVVDGAMNRHQYIQILRNQMLPRAMGAFGCNFVYVQDNALPHTARDTAAFLDQQDVEVMDWPARSPDMNPIVHVWDQMSVWIRGMDDPHPRGMDDIAPPRFHRSWTKQAVRQVWAAVRPGRVWTLVESLLRCVRALLAARGGHTCY